MSFRTDVWVGMMGSKLEAKTFETTGFRGAMLVISWCAWIMLPETVHLGVVVEVGSIIFGLRVLLFHFMSLISNHGLLGWFCKSRNLS